MGSLNASGIPVVSKSRLFVRRYGRCAIVSSGTNPYGAGSSETIKTEPPLTLMIGFTSGIIAADFYTEMDISPAIKVTNSANSGEVIARYLGKIPPSGNSQPEIYLKPVSQNSSFHAGGRIITANSDRDTIVSRTMNSGTRPPG